MCVCMRVRHFTVARSRSPTELIMRNAFRTSHLVRLKNVAHKRKANIFSALLQCKLCARTHAQRISAHPARASVYARVLRRCPITRMRNARAFLCGGRTERTRNRTTLSVRLFRSVVVFAHLLGINKMCRGAHIKVETSSRTRVFESERCRGFRVCVCTHTCGSRGGAAARASATQSSHMYMISR